MQKTQQVQQIEELKGMLIKKTSHHLKTDGRRAMTGNLSMKNRNTIYVKQAQALESTHATDDNFVSATISNDNTQMTTYYQ